MKGYTRKVGLRQPELQCTDCWLRGIPCEHPDLAWGQILALRRHKAHGNRPDPECPCNWPGELGARKVRPPAGLLDTIRKAAATLDGLPPEMPLSCPHCPCTQTTECCYCDGTRTPLEDS